MSKKIKGVDFDFDFDFDFDSSYEDGRARFKHQTLLQDYLELQKETEAARSKLEAMKQKKHTLEAEVRFLRRRHKFLIRSKSSTKIEQVIVKPHNLGTSQYRKSKKEKACSKKEATLQKISPIYNISQKGKVYTEKKNAISPTPPRVFDSSQKEQSFHMVINQTSDRIKSGGVKGILENNPFSGVDLNKKEGNFSSKEGGVQSRAPVFDLNKISMEEQEEEMEERLEEQRKGLMRSGIEEHNDLMLSVCRRNVGVASTSRAGKRKISWQDPVALRV